MPEFNRRRRAKVSDLIEMRGAVDLVSELLDTTLSHESEDWLDHIVDEIQVMVLRLEPMLKNYGRPS